MRASAEVELNFLIKHETTRNESFFVNGQVNQNFTDCYLSLEPHLALFKNTQLTSTCSAIETLRNF